MTPKKKAKELFDKYHLSFAGIVSFDDDWEALAKQCALIAVDEILKNDTIFLYVHHLDFWKEVKQEIENL
jgi:hypothetical protein